MLQPWLMAVYLIKFGGRGRAGRFDYDSGLAASVHYSAWFVISWQGGLAIVTKVVSRVGLGRLAPKPAIHHQTRASVPHLRAQPHAAADRIVRAVKVIAELPEFVRHPYAGRKLCLDPLGASRHVHSCQSTDDVSWRATRRADDRQMKRGQ